MRKAANVIISLIALAICALMTYLTFGSGLYTVIFNLAVLGVMLIIILFSWIFGFLRMGSTVRGLNTASRKLVAVYKDRAKLADITRAGTELFEVDYLDRKYNEYLGFLRKTNSPTDISDYVGEYEIRNYTHRRLLELVPDILTSLGILGTFMGLVWGLRGFNPVSYEAMASSITSLIDGIKVAFVTSIYGIALSIAYTFCLRGAVTELSESLDNFTDKYYLCAVPPTDATAMNHVLANQKEQINALKNLTQEIADQLAISMAGHMDPIMTQMNRTLENFTQVVTLQQEQLLENIAKQVMTSMRREFIADFTELHAVLKETNRVQKEFVGQMTQAQAGFNETLTNGAKAIDRQITSSSRQQADVLDRLNEQQTQITAQMEEQQRNLGEYVSYMGQAIQEMSRLQQENVKAGEAVVKQISAMEELTRRNLAYANAAGKSASAAEEAAERAEKPVRKTKIDDIDELTERMDQMILLLEKQERMLREQQKKRGLFR